MSTIMDTDSLYEHLEEVEEGGSHEPEIYLDSEKVPTIGVGFALMTKNSEGEYNLRSNLFDENGVFAEAGIDIPDNYRRIQNTLEDIATQLTDGNKTGPDSAEDIFDTNSEDLQSFSITDQEARDLFGEIQEGYEDEIIDGITDNNDLTTEEAEDVVEALPNDMQAAVFSCAYNTPDLIGPGLTSGLISSN